MKKNIRNGFTLVELLIVIGIIGVLSSVMLGLFSGSGNAAKATQCMTNLRGLSVAALNYAMQNKDGWFPTAGSLKWTNYAAGRDGRYPVREGWISWYDQGISAKNASMGAEISFNEADQKRLYYALTNGCIWATGSRSMKNYQCPVHAKACLSANKRNPGWSYVMNESFYWNSSGKPHKSWVGMSHGGMSPIDANSSSKSRVSRPPEKILLFAEIQGLDNKKLGLVANTSGGGTKGDSVLQYSSQNEVIGFNHEQNGGRLAGHVAFADGHVEKFLYPSSGDAANLTKWLCSGREVSFNGTQYSDITGN